MHFIRLSLITAILWIISDVSSNFNDSMVVSLSAGLIEGHLHKMKNGRSAYIFLGIPYAEPPVENLRFRPTVPKKPWGLFDDPPLKCHKYKPSCPQNMGTSYHPSQSEDCLYMNVFVGQKCMKNLALPFWNKRPLCPIYYLVHGGGNEFENPNIFPLDEQVNNFASKDIIFITVAYRIGILGFWNLGNQDYGGNWGLYDIVEGARWIQREARNFGGDSNQVTIGGLSSSAALILLLTLTPKTVGLFSQTIVMSATGSNGRMVINNETYYQMVTENLGCIDPQTAQKDSEFIADCMRQIPASILVDEYNVVRGYDPTANPQGFPDNGTLPRYDGPYGIFEKPYDLSMEDSYRRPIPTMIGTTNDESGFKKLELLNASAETLTSACRSTISNSSYAKKMEIIQACIDHYVNELGPYPNASDFVFPYWTDKSVELKDDFEYYSLCFKHAWTLSHAGAPVYLYSFDYEHKGLEGLSTWHAEDFSYLFGTHASNFTKEDIKMGEIYSDYFVNFIKHGQPMPSVWEKLRNDLSFNYFSINLNYSKMKNGYHQDGILFWNVKVAEIENSKQRKFLIIQKGLNKSLNMDINWVLPNEPKFFFMPIYNLIFLIALIIMFVTIIRCVFFRRMLKIDRRFEYEQID